MSLYRELLSSVLSTEGVQTSNIEFRPTPEGDGLISIKETSDTNEFHAELDQHLSFLNKGASMEGGEELDTSDHASGVIGVSVESGPFIRPILVRGINPNTTLEGLSKDQVLYINGEDTNGTLDWLSTEGYYVGNDEPSVYEAILRLMNER